jgi:predicted HD superfamily hydrolase involved in NAD metabolism
LPNTPSIPELQQQVQLLVSAERYQHILRVADLAVEIARANGFPAEPTYLAALLHDAARDFPPKRLLLLAPPENPTEQAHPLSLHGRVARLLAIDWGVSDPQVLEAIEGHVYGVDPSNGIGMALFLADISEPARQVNHDLRQLALEGHLLEAYIRAIDSKLEYLECKGVVPHPRTAQVRQRLLEAGLLPAMRV